MNTTNNILNVREDTNSEGLYPEYYNRCIQPTFTPVNPNNYTYIDQPMVPPFGQQNLSYGTFGFPVPIQLNEQPIHQAVTQQISAQRPAPIVGCPPGLEYLNVMNRLIIQKEIDLNNMFTNKITKRNYYVKSATLQQVYYAKEDSDTFIWSSDRDFVMLIMDNLGVEVMKVTRIRQGYCGPCFDNAEEYTQVLTVDSTFGQKIGSVYQQSSFCERKFLIKDSNENTILHLQKSGSMCEQSEFMFYSADMSITLGKIVQEMSEFSHGMFIQAERLSVSFPMDLCVKIKAVCLACVFLIDFIYYGRKRYEQQKEVSVTNS